MNHRPAKLGTLMVVLLSASLAGAAPPVTGGLRVMPAGPSASDVNTRALLTEKVKQSLAEVAVGVHLGRYAVAPSLVQLRRYVERGERAREATIVCMIELALVDDRGTILGSTRGRASVVGGTPADAIAAAAHAAVRPIPEAILAAERSHSSGT